MLLLCLVVNFTSEVSSYGTDISKEDLKLESTPFLFDSFPVVFLIVMAKFLTRTTEVRRKCLLWLTVHHLPGGRVHWGKGGHWSSCLTIRKQREMRVAALCSLRLQPGGWCHPHSRCVSCPQSSSLRTSQ